MTTKRSKRARRPRKKAARRSSSASSPPPDAPPPAALLGVTAYAKHRGVRLGAVQRAIADGRLRESVTTTASGRRMLDVAAADREWTSSTDPAQSERASAETRRRARERAEGPVAGEDLGESELEVEVDEDLDADYLRERAKRERHAAEKIKLEVRRLKGELIEAREVDLRMAEVSRRVRAVLLSLPNRLGPVLAAQSDAGACSRLLEAEITQALQVLVQEIRADAQAAAG